MTDVMTPSRSSLLRPFLPRPTLEWVADDPDRRWRSVEGTVVFVDISGFTQLSEKLAKAGKVGAEEMADAINSCFTELLTIAYEEDGSLVKFGGDALFLLFTGGPPQEHALRAMRAAAGMRRRLREVGKIQTTRGAVGLRMSVGVHTGTYDFFLVGESHRELIVTGPGATEVVSMEGTANAGEILMSPSTAAFLPARCIGDPKGRGVLLRATPPGDPAGLVSVIPHASDELLESCIPVASREQLLAGAREPEHRQVSVAFLHFDGSDEMRHEEGPEALADAIHELVVGVQTAVDEAQVSFLASDVDADGGKIILTAGVPRAVGDDDERMLLALRRIADMPRRLPLRIGVNHGGVFAGDIGPRYRRTYTVMGDTVNLAARVMSKAPPGEVYATGSVLDRSATRFEVSELEPFMVKGKAKPVQAWSVGPAIGSRARDVAQTRRLALVGRDEEIETLERLALQACSGAGHLVEIVGEPGIGKTRLLEELVERDCGLRIMHATAEAYTSSTPYATWRELLREMLDLGWEDSDDIVAERLRASVESLDPELTPWLPLIADAIDAHVPGTPEVDAIAPEFRRPKLQEVVGRFLGKALAAPTLIQVEDAHLMDPASSELLGSLAWGIGERPWLVAVARRDAGSGFEAPESEQVVRLDLAPLSREGTREMVLAVTEATPLLPRDEELVAARSGGNPQFLLDLVQAIASGSMLPDSVEAAATARIDSLIPSDRTLVRRAAIFGISFHPRFLGDVLDADTPAPDERTWERLSEFFDGDGDGDGDGYLRFRRAVVRDAAYEGLPFRTRRTLHRIVGIRLEQEVPDPDETGGLLSLHFFLAGDNAKAFRYARIAADRAAERFAIEEAAHLYQRAIDAARRLPDVTGTVLGELFESLCVAHFDGGDFRKASEACSIARHYYAAAPVDQARMLFRRSRIEHRFGRYSRALWWASRARSVLAAAERSDARSLEAEVGAWYASLLQLLGRNAASTTWGRRAVGEAEAAGNLGAVADAYDVLDTVNLMLGKPTGEYWQRALAIFEELEDLAAQQRILGNLGAGSYAQGRWDDAIAFYERSTQMASRIGDVVSAAVDLINMGEIASDRGEFDEAELLFRESLRVWRASEYRFYLAGCLYYLGRVVARSGRFDEAFELYREAEEVFAADGARDFVLEVKARVAECFTFRQEPKAALAQLAEVDAESGESIMSAPLVSRVRGYALAQIGDLAGARSAFEESLAVSRERGADFDVSQAITGLIRLAKMEGSTIPSELAAEGNAIWERLRIRAVVTVPLQIG